MIKRILAFVLLVSINLPALAGPITTVVSLTPTYNSREVQIEWQHVLPGGCTSANTAVTNPGAINSDNLVSVLLTAFASGKSVEVFFGGGCHNGDDNWIQTVRIIN